MDNENPFWHQANRRNKEIFRGYKEELPESKQEICCKIIDNKVYWVDKKEKWLGVIVNGQWIQPHGYSVTLPDNWSRMTYQDQVNFINPKCISYIKAAISNDMQIKLKAQRLRKPWLVFNCEVVK